ncbi:hypothetical protein QWZ10_21130 [Paracoccus cavernae]|uniref:ABC transporter substrate-binding protein n=1 Tax=Paracoccus cavernae TaxID=1571207 RepID=A0ABT8DBG3_9RHOB|nr:hypothetical protein [Paracoccus cavernae]
MKKLLLSASLALAFTAIQGQTALAQTAITVGSDVDAGTLDPRLTRDVTAARVADLIYSGLVHLTPALEPVPDLAESWETPDPTTYIFHLREGWSFRMAHP